MKIFGKLRITHEHLFLTDVIHEYEQLFAFIHKPHTSIVPRHVKLIFETFTHIFTSYFPKIIKRGLVKIEFD